MNRSSGIVDWLIVARSLCMMSRGLYYFAVAVALVLGTIVLPRWWMQVVTLWGALACVWFGIGYLFSRGELLFKSKEGRLPVWVKLLLLPVLVGVMVYNFFARRVDSAPPLQEVDDGLWVGRRLLPLDVPRLNEHRISAILDVTAEFDSLPKALLPEGIHYLNVPVFDHDVMRMSQLRRAVNWIHEERRAGRKVVVHCALGQGRSVTVILAYLAALYPGRDHEEILEAIRQVRASVNPNRRQIRLVEEFLKSGHGLEKPQVRLFYNPAAGSGDSEQQLKRIRACLEPFVTLEVSPTLAGSDLGALTRKALDEGIQQIVVAGGDGTVGEVAAAMVGSEIPLGIIPLGTANALAVSLYGESVRLDPIRFACRHILSGSVRAIDAAKYDDGHFMLLAGIGFEAGMIEHADREKKDNLGAMAYLLGAFEALDDQNQFRVRLEIDGESFEYETGSVVVANVAPMTSVLAQGGGPPDFTDGKLDVTVIEATGERAVKVSTLLKLMIQGESAEDPPPGIHHHQGRRVRITTEPDLTSVIDGELVDRSSMTIEAVAAALRVLVADQSVLQAALDG